jgi:hypothetical protein
MLDEGPCRFKAAFHLAMDECVAEHGVGRSSGI